MQKRAGFPGELDELHKMCIRDSGYIVSADEKLVKPNGAIYQLLCKRYQLEPEECFFIDDRAENVEAARQCGMYAYQYQSDVQALYSALQRAGVNI